MAGAVGRAPEQTAGTCPQASCPHLPGGTGLGWGGIHPRAILRLSDETLEWLADVLRHRETTGAWPDEVSIVIIALLPKTDGGFALSGLSP